MYTNNSDWHYQILKQMRYLSKTRKRYLTNNMARSIVLTISAEKRMTNESPHLLQVHHLQGHHVCHFCGSYLDPFCVFCADFHYQSPKHGYAAWIAFIKSLHVLTKFTQSDKQPCDLQNWFPAENKYQTCKRDIRYSWLESQNFVDFDPQKSS